MGLRIQCRCLLTSEFVNERPCYSIASAEDGFCDTCRGHCDGEIIPPDNECKHAPGRVSFNPTPQVVEDEEIDTYFYSVPVDKELSRQEFATFTSLGER